MNTVLLVNLSLLCFPFVFTDIPSPPITKHVLRSVRFADTTHGWIAGYRGVFHTKDGGETWQRLSITVGSMERQSPRAALEDAGYVCLVSEEEATIRTDRGLTAVGSDSAIKRQVLFSKDALEDLYAISFTDKLTGAGLGYSRRFYRTTDGGTTWHVGSKRMPESAIGLYARSATEIWAIGNRCTVLHTTDGGQNWQRSRLIENSFVDLYCISFRTPDDGWICGSSGIVFRTIDGGRTWQKQRTPVAKDVLLTSISFSDSNEGWAVGSRYLTGVKKDAIALHTEDAGLTWEVQSTGLDDVLVEVQALPRRGAWAVGSNGTLIRTANGGKHWTQVKLH